VKIDVEGFLIKMGVDYVQSKDRLLVCCPFHDDSNPSCGLWEDTGYFKCWGCGETGSFAEYVAKVEDITLDQARRKLRGQTSVTDLQDMLGKMLDKREEEYKYYSIPSFLKAFPPVQAGGPGWDYLTETTLEGTPGWPHPNGRGVRPEFVSLYRMRWGGASGKYRNRVILPIFSPSGKLIAYAGRTVVPGMVPKTKKSRSPHHTLYGLYELLKMHPVLTVIIVVEGEFDAIYLQQFGIPAVSNMGTAPLNPEKILLLRKYCKKVVIAYDADDAGESAMYGVHGVPGKKDREGTVDALSRHLPTISVNLPEGRDPNELSEQEVYDIFGEWKMEVTCV